MHKTMTVALHVALRQPMFLLLERQSMVEVFHTVLPKKYIISESISARTTTLTHLKITPSRSAKVKCMCAEYEIFISGRLVLWLEWLFYERS